MTSRSARNRTPETAPESKSFGERAAGLLSELAQVDPSVVNVRRGLIRVLIMAAGLFWLVAAADTFNAYGSAPARDGLILRTEEGSYYQVEIPGGQTCETGIGEIARDFGARGMGTLREDACTHHEANQEALRARDGRRAAVDVLSGYAIGFAVVAGLIAAAWWAGRGFLPARAPSDEAGPARRQSMEPARDRP